VGSPRIAADDLFRPGVEVAETHVSRIAFIGDRAHKLKKAVRFAFVDLSTPERREWVCRREVELNRRFSPDVYLGVEEVVDDEGRVVDHAVLMRRMPAARRLATLITTGRDVSPCLQAVARIMAGCHARAATSDQIRAVATPRALRRLWHDNLVELDAFVPSILDRPSLGDIERLATRYLAGRGVLLAERSSAGRIVDGHGDLLADDIFCLDDGPRILDCLEFDDALRWGDVLYDVGFLAMDLERLGHPELARSLLDEYRRLSGENHPRSLEDHYIAYRALVRAKVSCLKGTPADHAEASRYIAQCLEHLRAARVRLVLVGGLPGTGKTTVARGLARTLGWTVLSSDELRKQDAGLDTVDHAAAEFGHGLYTSAATERTYRVMLERAGTLLARGESVILDASFAQEPWRQDAAVAAGRLHADLVELCCQLPSETAAGRLVERARGHADASDADPSVAAVMAGRFTPWPSATPIDTRSSPAEVQQRVLAVVDADRPSIGP
jgi:aminoglycoside phosphotransferase family enzyme/predicted kinase